MELRLQIGGAEVIFSFWFFAVIAVFLLLDRNVLLWYLVLPVLIHELGHFLAMALCGVRIRAIAFTPVSVNIRRRSNISVRREVAVTLGGVAANLLASALLYLFCFQSMRVMLLLAANVAVALFNLLPVGNLDGGQLCSLLCMHFFTPRLALVISRAVSFLALTPLCAAAVLLLLRGGNFTLLLMCAYLGVTIVLRD